MPQGTLMPASDIAQVEVIFSVPHSVTENVSIGGKIRRSKSELEIPGEQPFKPPAPDQGHHLSREQTAT